jgi:molybdate transport system substrate-binding protein
VLSANGMRGVVEDLGPKFERATGHKLETSFATFGAIIKRMQGGETANVVILHREAMDQLLKHRKVDGSSTADLARASIGLIVRRGAPKPDISTPEKLKFALLTARAITYADPESESLSGRHFARVLEGLGIAADMKKKTIFHSYPREAAVLVGKGQAEIGVDLIQELLHLPGVEFLGALPGDLQSDIVYTAAVTNTTKDKRPMTALIAFMRSSAAAVVLKAYGMQPE